MNTNRRYFVFYSEFFQYHNYIISKHYIFYIRCFFCVHYKTSHAVIIINIFEFNPKQIVAARKILDLL